MTSSKLQKHIFYYFLKCQKIHIYPEKKNNFLYNCNFTFFPHYSYISVSKSFIYFSRKRRRTWASETIPTSSITAKWINTCSKYWSIRNQELCLWYCHTYHRNCHWSLTLSEIYYFNGCTYFTSGYSSWTWWSAMKKSDYCLYFDFFDKLWLTNNGKKE